MNIGQARGLGMVDAEGKKLSLNTDAWKRIYTFVVEGYKSGMLQWSYSPEDNSLEPFYQVTYDETVQGGYNDNIPREFFDAYRKVSLQQAADLLKGDVSVEKGLQQLREQGQRALDQAHTAAVK
ncbi:MAG: hypothetical protein K0S39_1618 [Paenibacillus sp.]|jgi:hypothetical protein|nr:hypothetical protein [Paenibacillus sp.]